MTSALVLVGMSISDVVQRDTLLAAARQHRASLAYLQMGEPSLSSELTRLADLGTSTIVLVGVNTGPIAPAHSWLRRIAAHWWRERGAQRPCIDVATRLITTPDDLDVALLATKPIHGDEAGLTSQAWESVTAHRHQVLICRGPRCTAQGSEQTARALILGLMEAGLGDDEVLITHTGCLFPCNQAPVLSVQPDDVWYGQVDGETATRIVAEHFLGASPVETHRLPR